MTKKIVTRRKTVVKSMLRLLPGTYLFKFSLLRFFEVRVHLCNLDRYLLVYFLNSAIFCTWRMFILAPAKTLYPLIQKVSSEV